MRRPGRQDDHGPAARSIIARIDRAFIDLPEVRPGAGPYLRRLTGCGWSGGTPAQELLRHVVVDVAAELYRERADPPVNLLEFSDGAFDVLFDAAHEPGSRQSKCDGGSSAEPGRRSHCVTGA